MSSMYRDPKGPPQTIKSDIEITLVIDFCKLFEMNHDHWQKTSKKYSNNLVVGHSSMSFIHHDNPLWFCVGSLQDPYGLRGVVAEDTHHPGQCRWDARECCCGSSCPKVDWGTTWIMVNGCKWFMVHGDSPETGHGYIQQKLSVLESWDGLVFGAALPPRFQEIHSRITHAGYDSVLRQWHWWCESFPALQSEAAWTNSFF